MALSFLNRCGFRASSSGTGSFVVASALANMQTPAQAAGPAVVNGNTYRYFAESDDGTQWEYGTGAYTTGDVTLTRATVYDNSSGGTTALSFSAAPKVFMGGPLAQDMIQERIAHFDFAGTPAAGVAVPINFALYSRVEMHWDGVLVDDPGLDDDEINGPYYSIDNSSASEILSEQQMALDPQNPNFILASEYTGSFEENSYEQVAIGLYVGHGSFAWSFLSTAVSKNVLEAGEVLSDPQAISVSGAGANNGMSETTKNIIVNIYAKRLSNSAVATFDRGTLSFYGWRKS